MSLQQNKQFVVMIPTENLTTTHEHIINSITFQVIILIINLANYINKRLLIDGIFEDESTVNVAVNGAL